MLAKVLKKEQAADFATFSIPEIGEMREQSTGVNAFVVPEFVKSQFSAVTELKTADPFCADDVVQNARDQAALIIAQAEESKAIIEQAARESAIFEARAEFETEVAGRVSEIRQQLVETIDRLSALANEITRSAESELVELALQIAKKIVGREVAADREITVALVKASLGKLHNRSIAEVHLNPEDFAFVDEHRERLDFRGSLELVEDRSISVGGCLIHTETGDIDARIESQFDEIAHGLLN